MWYVSEGGPQFPLTALEYSLLFRGKYFQSHGNKGLDDSYV